jgi:DNA-binding NarL/FixJ family response regulator
MQNQSTYVGIIEDDAEIRNGIITYLSGIPGISNVWGAGSVEDFFELLPDHPQTNIVLTDIGLPGKSGIEGIKLIRQTIKNCDVIMLTVFNDDNKIFKSLCAGASGYLLKGASLNQIGEAVHVIANGGSYMSPAIARKVITYFNPKPKTTEALTVKEKQIVQALVDGLSYKMIADRLLISIDGVRYHIKNIYTKLQVNSKGEVISKSIKNNLF